MKGITKYLKQIVFVLIYLFTGIASGQEVIKGDNDYLGHIGQQIFFFVEESGELSETEALEKFRAGQFEKSDKEIFIQPSPVPTYWLAFKLHSELDEDLWMNLANSTLEKIDFFKFDHQNKMLDEWHTGSIYPDSTKAYDAFTFWFPLTERSETDTATFLLRINASLSMEAPIEVGTLLKLSEKKDIGNYLAVFFLGAMIIMFVYNLFIFILTGDYVYGIYTFCIFSIMFGTTYLNNYPIIEWFLGKELTNKYTACWMWTNLLSMGLFAMAYLKIKENFPIIYKIMWAEMIIICGYALLNLFIPVKYLSLSFQVVVVIFYVTCLYTSYYFVWYLRDARALLYSINWSLVMVGGFVFLLVINGVMPYTAITRNIMYFGVIAEILIFSIALARKLNHMRERHVHMNTVLAEANQALQQNNESLDSFNYHVSHDLKTVLNNSNALSRMIEKYSERKDYDKVIEITQKLRTVTENGAETVQSFLSIGKVDSIFRNENTEEIKLVEEVRSIIDRNNLGDQIKVQIIKDEIGKMTIHTKALESIFLNFFTNSIKYAEKNPKAEIQFLNRNKHYLFIYKDNGTGIDMQRYGKDLFKPFQRAGVSSDVEGTGIGLYTVQKIVTNYGGTITLESELGKGVLFTLSFPKN